LTFRMKNNCKVEMIFFLHYLKFNDLKITIIRFNLLKTFKMEMSFIRVFDKQFKFVELSVLRLTLF
jgi:hypothetical protein